MAAIFFSTLPIDAPQIVDRIWHVCAAYPYYRLCELARGLCAPSRPWPCALRLVFSTSSRPTRGCRQR
jgi:hypothetical protein